MKRLRARYGCPVELALDVLDGKWKPVILARLKEGPLRYGALRALVPGLSDKVLTERLHDLEELGLIDAERLPGVPGARYRLSARGESLKPVLQSLYDWGLVAAREGNVRLEL